MHQYNLWMIVIIIAIIVTWRVYKKRRPLTKYKQYHDRAFDLEMKNKYKEAIEIKEQGLQLNTLTNLERADLLFSIGGTFFRLHDYQKASSYFDKAFDLAASEKIPYNKQYKLAIDAYVKAGRQSDAAALLDQLIERQKYDKKFKRFEVLKEDLKE